MHEGTRRRTARGMLVVLAAAAVAAATAVSLWGASWTIPQAPSPNAGYELKAAWDGREIPGGRLERPIGIAVAPSGEVFVTDARMRVIRFSAAGEFRGEWGRGGDGRGEFRNPVGVAVGPRGLVYVSDYEQDRIQKFTSAGEFLQAFGRSGTGAGELSAPAGLAVAPDGGIHVADFYNHRVQAWREDGSFQRTMGRPGRLGPGALHYPTGIAVTPGRELLVADAYNYQLQWFGLDGRPHRRIGYHLFWLWPRPRGGRAGFSVPTGAAAGRNGFIHVADSGNRRVVMLTAEGEYVAEWRVPDPAPNIYSPEHVATSPDGATVYATDLARNRVLVLEMTPQSPGGAP